MTGIAVGRLSDPSRRLAMVAAREFSAVAQRIRPHAIFFGRSGERRPGGAA